jgi:hypothetical protein
MPGENNENKLPEYHEFYTNIGLYSSYKFTENNRDEIFNILFSQESIDLHCIDCKTVSVFVPIDNRPYKIVSKGVYATNSSEWYYDLNSANEIFEKAFICSRNEEHFISFFILLKNGTITKIGQYPSVADIAEYDIKKYEKILGKFYIEFKTAVGLFAHGIGAGAYVYLRRIIENFIIRPAYEEAKLESSWNEDEYQKSRYREKIVILKDKLPKFLTDNTKLYSVLSKGLHDMTEDECKKNFPVIKNSIEIILDDMQAQQEKEQKRLEMKKALSKI